MDVKIIIYFVIAYLVPSTWESIAHRLFLHATLRERHQWRHWRLLGQLLRLAYFYHNRVHHHRTYRNNLVIQFSDAHEKEHLKKILKGKIAGYLHANRYGTTIATFWETIAFVAPPLILSGSLFLFLAPSLLPVCIFFSFVPYLLTKFIHPLLHMSDSDIALDHGKFLRSLVKTPVFRYLQTYHHQHHRHENCNFNLMLGADWFFHFLFAHQHSPSKTKL